MVKTVQGKYFRYEIRKDDGVNDDIHPILDSYEDEQYVNSTGVIKLRVLHDYRNGIDIFNPRYISYIDEEYKTIIEEAEYRKREKLRNQNKP